MTKDEMKNRISMALKDPILQQGFECICKENAELNKELKAEKEYSATLRKEIDEYTNSHTLCAKYKKLEEENAELKEEMKAKQVVLNDFKSRVETVTDRFNKKSSQLTKAKELLRMVIDSYFHKERFSFEKDLIKAEQFLEKYKNGIPDGLVENWIMNLG